MKNEVEMELLVFVNGLVGLVWELITEVLGCNEGTEDQIEDKS